MKSDRSWTVPILALSAGIFLILGVGKFLHVDFWLLPPAKKLDFAWSEDLGLVEKSGKLPKEWRQIKQIEVTGDNSQVQEWLKKIAIPIRKNADGRYRLQIFITQWIDGYRYGVVIQYHLIDLVSQNTIWEDGRTFKLGIVY